MGKSRRNTAKTGDKGIYKKREALESSNQPQGKKDDDPMYDEIDQFHNQEDYLQLDAGKGLDSEDEIDRQEAVMDLGVGGQSSSSEDDDDSSTGSDEKEDVPDASDDEEEGEGGAISSDEDDDQVLPMKSIRDWGRQKKDYYDGDTADLEIGQEEEDALVEEEAAKEIQAARYDQMDEQDFVLSDDEDDTEEGAKTRAESLNTMTHPRDWKKLSRPEKSKLLDRKHPELLPLVGHFRNMLGDWKNQTDVVTRALLEGEDGTAQAVGATKLGQEYLLSKAMIQASAGLNLAAYFLLKSDQAASSTEEDGVDAAWIQTHPVMKHLHKLNALVHKLEDEIEGKVPGLDDQLEKLVKASALLAHGQVDLEQDEQDDEDDNEDTNLSGEEDGVDMTEEKKEAAAATVSSQDDDSDNSESDSDNEAVDATKALEKRLKDEARFGLRQSEMTTSRMSSSGRRRAPISDFGDEDAADAEVGKSLAATLNAIEQRSSTRKRKVAPVGDAIDEANDEDRMRHALDMMEADLGPASDDELVVGANEDDDDGDEDGLDREVEGDDGENAFYAHMVKKSKSKKDFKKTLYTVKPKYPRMEEEVEGERPITKTILKNRGLVAHKNKLNRNPRVKKREQYRKALIRRKGAVRELRTDEGHKYGGEATGIKSNISRSRRLAS